MTSELNGRAFRVRRLCGAMLMAMRPSERLAKARRSVNAWAKAPATPSYDFGDLYWFTTYIERRSVIVTFGAFLAMIAASALVTDLIWGVPERVPMAVCAMFFWPAAWSLYLRHHYKKEYLREGSGSYPQELPGERQEPPLD